MRSLRESRLFGLLGSESLRVFNDNLIRVVVILLLIGDLETEPAVQAATAKVQVAYTLPWILLSVPAGMFADRLSKRTVLRGLKLGEVLVMGFAAWVLARGGEREALSLLGVIALVGTLSATASPAKYGILPEILPPERLARGNGALLLWTYAATVSGTALGGVLLDLLRPRPEVIALLLAVVAAWGWRLSGRIPRVPAARSKGGFRDTVRQGLGALERNGRLRLGLYGNVGYWGLAALWLQVLVTYAKSELGLSDTRKGLLLTAVAVGIGAGGLLAGFASRGRVRLAFLPLGTAGMGAVAVVIGQTAPGFSQALLLLVALGMAAGFFAVPVNTLIQEQSPASSRGAVLALMNMFVFTAIILGSVLGWALARAGLPALEIFLVTGEATIVAALLMGALGRRVTRA